MNDASVMLNTKQRNPVMFDSKENYRNEFIIIYVHCTALYHTNIPQGKMTKSNCK